MNIENLQKNNQGFLLVVILVMIAIIGIFFASYYVNRLKTSKQMIKNTENQKEYIEKKLQDSIKDAQDRIEIPQDLVRE